MISIYCKSKHKSSVLCENCSELELYAHLRLEKCKFGNNKPNCKNCPVHCYKHDKRDEIREVMKFAGPRMLFKHPYLAIRHLFKK